VPRPKGITRDSNRVRVYDTNLRFEEIGPVTPGLLWSGTD